MIIEIVTLLVVWGVFGYFFGAPMIEEFQGKPYITTGEQFVFAIIIGPWWIIVLLTICAKVFQKTSEWHIERWRKGRKP